MFKPLIFRLAQSHPYKYIQYTSMEIQLSSQHSFKLSPIVCQPGGWMRLTVHPTFRGHTGWFMADPGNSTRGSREHLNQPLHSLAGPSGWFCDNNGAQFGRGTLSPEKDVTLDVNMEACSFTETWLRICWLWKNVHSRELQENGVFPLTEATYVSQQTSSSVHCTQRHVNRYTFQWLQDYISIQ